MVKVKICGVTRAEDARVAVEAGAAAIGLNFCARSPRCVSMETATRIAAELPAPVCAVGVFVDEPRERVVAIARAVGLRGIQFHGDEPPEYCADWPFQVIKAVRVRDRESVANAAAYPVDFVLFDAYVEGQAGGTGQRFSWQWLAAFERSRMILAGGLTPANVAEAVRCVRPFAVDVASGVESRPGIKDAELIRRFIANAQTA